MTDLEIYDRSVFAYLQEFGIPVGYTPVDLAIKNAATYNSNSDDIPWSFISFYRNSSIDIDYSRSNFTQIDLGDAVSLESDGRVITATYVQSLPVNLTYQVDIWSSKAVSVQDLAIQLICKLHMYGPVLHAPMNPGGEDARFHLLDVRWDDNSDLVNEADIGRIYRHTISFTVECQIKRVIDRRSPVIPEVPIDIYEGGSSLINLDNFKCSGYSEDLSICENCKYYKPDINNLSERGN